jgi:hypothetical protein
LHGAVARMPPGADRTHRLTIGDPIREDRP